MTHKEVLQNIYNNALEVTSNADYTTTLSEDIATKIKKLVSHSETSKGIITVLIYLQPLIWTTLIGLE